MRIDIRNTGCCALRELEDICLWDSRPKRVVNDVCESRFEDEQDCAFYLFTDVAPYKHGESLKVYIIENRLGSVMETKGKRNPNSSNNVRCYIWKVNNTKLKKWKHDHYELDVFDEEDCEGCDDNECECNYD